MNEMQQAFNSNPVLCADNNVLQGNLWALFNNQCDFLTTELHCY